MQNNSNNTYNLLKFIHSNKLLNWSVKYLLDSDFSYNDKFNLTSIGSFLKRNKTQVAVQDNVNYKRVTIKINNGGIYLRDKEIGKSIGTKKQFEVKKGQFLLSKIDARNGAFGVVPKEVDTAIITGNFWTYDVDYLTINPHYLALITTTKQFISFCQRSSAGTTNRHYLQEQLFLNEKIPLPALPEQEKIVKAYQDKITQAEKLEQEATNLENDIEEFLLKELGIEIDVKGKRQIAKLYFIDYENLEDWNINTLSKETFLSKKYETVSFNEDTTLYKEIFRGKSPKYDKASKSIILNQKCNRWNHIELEYAKTVKSVWLNSINKKFFTKQNDIIINSTGDGTIGRATVITKVFEDLLYDSHILLLRLNDDKINPFYYIYLFNSKYGQDQVELIKSAQSTKQTELGINNLKKIYIPLPPKATQNKIATAVHQMKETQKQKFEKAQQLRQQALIEFENTIFKPV